MQDTDKEEWAGGVAWLHIGIEVQGPAEGGGKNIALIAIFMMIN